MVFYIDHIEEDEASLRGEVGGKQKGRKILPRSVSSFYLIMFLNLIPWFMTCFRSGILYMFKFA